MAGTDAQKQWEEAAAERSGIAKALLSIQQTLDRMEPAVAKMEPAVAKMEPTLVALELVVQDLATWRPTWTRRWDDSKQTSATSGRSWRRSRHAPR